MYSHIGIRKAPENGFTRSESKGIAIQMRQRYIIAQYRAQLSQRIFSSHTQRERRIPPACAIA